MIEKGSAPKYLSEANAALTRARAAYYKAKDAYEKAVYTYYDAVKRAAKELHPKSGGAPLKMMEYAELAAVQNPDGREK